MGTDELIGSLAARSAFAVVVPGDHLLPSLFSTASSQRARETTATTPSARFDVNREPSAGDINLQLCRTHVHLTHKEDHVLSRSPASNSGSAPPHPRISLLQDPS
jgi:hypothetical protein